MFYSSLNKLRNKQRISITANTKCPSLQSFLALTLYVLSKVCVEVHRLLKLILNEQLSDPTLNLKQNRNWNGIYSFRNRKMLQLWKMDSFKSFKIKWQHAFVHPVIIRMICQVWEMFLELVHVFIWWMYGIVK